MSKCEECGTESKKTVCPECGEDKEMKEYTVRYVVAMSVRAKSENEATDEAYERLKEANEHGLGCNYFFQDCEED